jgi:hypothetical protein
MALKGHRRKTKKKKWAKYAKGGCRYGRLKHPRGRRICRKVPKKR